MTPWTIGCCDLYHADCRDLLPCLQGVTVLITDPPYGIGYRQKRSRDKWVHPETEHPMIAGDGVPFDPSHLLGFPRVILWGANHYAQQLPPSPRWLIWDKRKGSTPNDSSDGELAWTNLPGPLRIYYHLWRGIIREGEENVSRGGKKLHPHQKPVALMQWCLEQATVHPRDVVCDPYMGSASLGVACLRRGVRYIGIESDPGYYRTAVERLRHEAARLQHLPAGALDGLSRQQRQILLQLLWSYQQSERAGGPHDLDRGGVPWRIHGTCALQASTSRALRRLEKRGLVLRQPRVSGPADGRCYVRLLPAGREIAERLTHSRR